MNLLRERPDDVVRVHARQTVLSLECRIQRQALDRRVHVVARALERRHRHVGRVDNLRVGKDLARLLIGHLLLGRPLGLIQARNRLFDRAVRLELLRVADEALVRAVDRVLKEDGGAPRRVARRVGDVLLLPELSLGLCRS